MIPLIAAASAADAIGKVATAVTSLARGLSRSGTSPDVNGPSQALPQESFESLVAAHGATQGADAGTLPAAAPHGHAHHGHGKASRAVDQVA